MNAQLYKCVDTLGYALDMQISSYLCKYVHSE